MVGIPSGESQLKLFTLDVLLLPKGSRSPASITVTADSNVAVGATTATLSASSPTLVKAGNSLSFLAASPTGTSTRSQLVVSQDTTISTGTSVPIFEAVSAVAATDVATYYTGLLPVVGLQQFNLQSQDQKVDTTNTLSGFGTENALVRSGKMFNCSGIQIIGDKGLYTIIKPVVLTGSLFGREIWAVMTNPDGEIYLGAAKVSNFQAPGNQNEVKKFSFDLEFQGSSFQYLTPYFN